MVVHTKKNKPEKKLIEKYDFAFLVHPRSILDIFENYPFLKMFPKKIVEIIFKRIPPIKLASIVGAIDENGLQRKGVIISLSLTAEQMLQNREVAKRNVVKAIKKAKKMGATYVGLGSFTSVVTSGGEDVKNSVEGVHVTNGNALTAHMTYLGIQSIINAHPKDSLNMAIIGATGSIGSAVTELLSKNGSFKTLYIVGRTPSRIQSLLQRIIPHPHAHRVINSSLEEALINSDIILSATSASGSVVNIEMLKKNAVIYDITQPKNIPPGINQLRPDVTVIDGGLVELPENIIVKYNFGIPKGVTFSCLAETILLSLSQYPDDFCIGNVKLEQVEYAEMLANRFKFKPIKIH